MRDELLLTLRERKESQCLFGYVEKDCSQVQRTSPKLGQCAYEVQLMRDEPPHTTSPLPLPTCLHHRQRCGTPTMRLPATTTTTAVIVTSPDVGFLQQWFEACQTRLKSWEVLFCFLFCFTNSFLLIVNRLLVLG